MPLTPLLVASMAFATVLSVRILPVVVQHRIVVAFLVHSSAVVREPASAGSLSVMVVRTVRMVQMKNARRLNVQLKRSDANWVSHVVVYRAPLAVTASKTALEEKTNQIVKPSAKRAAQRTRFNAPMENVYRSTNFATPLLAAVMVAMNLLIFAAEERGDAFQNTALCDVETVDVDRRPLLAQDVMGAEMVPMRIIVQFAVSLLDALLFENFKCLFLFQDAL